MRSFLLLLITMSTLAPGACLPITGDRILGTDLASADAKFHSLPATLQLGYAPAPGTSRVFAKTELEQIARANKLQASGFADICFEIPVHVPTDTEVMDAMLAELPADAKLRLTDMARTPVPSGTLRFPLAELEPRAIGNEGAQLWRGFVQYTGTRRAPIWAHVVISITYKTVVTRSVISADSPIDSASLEVVTKTGPMRRDVAAARIDQVAGHVIHRPLAAGAEIPLALIDEPPAIRRGDLVRVEVRSGLAILHFDAVAESTTRAGEYAEFRNPATGKTFKARVEAASKAVVIVGKGPAL